MSEATVIWVAEVICEALHRHDWELLGEPNGSRGPTWWRRGNTKDKMMRVQVCRDWDDDAVIVIPEWLILMPDARFIRAYEQIRISCNSTMTRERLEQATAACQMNLLETMRDIFQGVGKASPLWAAKHLNRKTST
jgi:hypothetical protein